jgi:hypothetical protein
VIRAQEGVFEEGNEVGFGSLLKGHDGVGLETKVRPEVLGHLADEALERKLADEKLGRPLVPADLTESDGARSVAMGLLHACTIGSLGGYGLPRSFLREMHAGSPTPRTLTGSLLVACHY